MRRIITNGILGWSNGDRRGGSSGFDAYGPAGRWGARGSRPGTSSYPGGFATRGDHLADHLAAEGAQEGDRLLVVVLDRSMSDAAFGSLRQVIEDTVHGLVP